MFGLKDIEPVYLDYAASTPVAESVGQAIARSLSAPLTRANPSSTHADGVAASREIAAAAAAVGASVGLPPEAVIWTSGATESDNLAILGAARQRRAEGRHVIANRIEHKAVVDPFKQLEREGFEVTWVAPAADGSIAPEVIAGALRDDTTLVSVMWVNNELGTVNDIAGIGAVLAGHAALLHVDAAQAWGKLPLDPVAAGVDMLSITAHKAYGPKGIGALLLSDAGKAPLEPLLFGGGQQQGLRPGTLPTHQIVGVGATAARIQRESTADREHVAALGGRLERSLLAVEGVSLNGAGGLRLPSIVNVAVAGVDGRSLLAAMAPVMVSAGSACNSLWQEPSFVLKALGLSDALAQASLRFSVGRPTTVAEVDAAASRFAEVVTRLRQIAGPLGRTVAA